MKKKNRFWKDFPYDLKLMCLLETHGSGNFCTKPALDLLTDRMNKCDSFVSGMTPYDVMHWIDTVVEICLFPLEHHVDDWTANREQIRRILNRQEELIRKVAPADYKEGYRTPDDDRNGNSIIKYAQKLDVYFSVLYMFTGEWQKLQERLSCLLSGTKRNVSKLPSRYDAIMDLPAASRIGFRFVEMDSLEPLNWLCREVLPGAAGKLFTQVYEQYVLYLYGFTLDENSPRIYSLLYKDAEGRLKRLCKTVLDGIEDQEGSFIAENKRYEEILMRSEERHGEEVEEPLSFENLIDDDGSELPF